MIRDPQALATAVVEGMFAKDTLSQWLGIQVTEVTPGKATCTMTVRDEMLNGFGLCHGGVTFCLADSALAFASNTNGQITVSVDNSISYPAPVHAGDRLTARAEEESAGRRLAFYRVTVSRQDGTTVAHFRGTVYRTGRQHEAAQGSGGGG